MNARIATPLECRWLLRSLAASIAILAMTACSQTVEVPQFGQERAFEYLSHQLSFGPRVPGTDAHRRCAEWLNDELSKFADSVEIQGFVKFVPLMDDTLTMMNIIGRFNTDASRRIVLGAHWDCRAYADMDPDTARHREPVMGANDAASGVAVLLELARAFADTPPPMGVDIVLFDGEDQGRYRSQSEWAMGSVEYVSRNQTRYDWGVLVDMVGERGAEFPREGYSYKHARALQDKIWALAAQLGEVRFLERLEEDVLDDHVAFLMHNIPMVDIIDLRYPSWHTTEDTLDKCAPESLGSVGRVLLHLIYAK